MTCRDGPVGAVDGQRDAQAVGVGGDGIEQRACLLRREAGGDHAHVDVAGIHGGEQLRQGRRGRQVAAEQLGDALVAGLAQEGRGGLAAERVDPEIDDRHPGSEAPGDGAGAGRRRSGRRPRPAGLGLGLGGPQVTDARGERLLDEPVVVLGDEGVHALLEDGTQERVEGVVRLGEVDPGRPVADVLQARPTSASEKRGRPTALYFHETFGVTSVSHSQDWPLPPVSR